MNLNLFKHAVVVVILSSAGCGHQIDGTNLQLNTNSQQRISQDSLIIQAVENWYRKQGYKVPSRILITGRSEQMYVVKAGAESKEATIRIDPKNLNVIEFRPGF